MWTGRRLRFPTRAGGSRAAVASTPRTAPAWRAARTGRASLAILATLATLSALVALAPASHQASGQTNSGQTGGPAVTSATTLPLVPSTTAAPPPSTVPATTTTPTTAPPKGGVPPVPVGGPPTTAPPKGTPPPPPPDPTPILIAVNADLTQLTAIADYKQAQANVASSQQAVTAAGAALQSTQNVLVSAVNSQQQAAARVGDASNRLEHLAIAAYVGLGYATPAAGPQGVGPSRLSTVSTPGGLTGELAGDAQEMLHLVAQHVRHDLADTREALNRAEQVTAKANGFVQQAEAGVAAAEAGLQSAQQTLAVVTQAATVPGAAAEIGLLQIPNGYLAAVAPPSTTPGSPNSSSGSSSFAAAPTAPTTTIKPSRSRTPGSVAASLSLPAPVSPSILGPSMLTDAEILAWFNSTGHAANTTVPIQQLIADYDQAGQPTTQPTTQPATSPTTPQTTSPTQPGVRYDIAFAQSVVETGYFSFPAYGQLTVNDNNFAGIGACDSCAHGWHFPDALTGVSAQMELLEAYASSTKVDTHLIGNVGVGGCCTTWMALAGKWASSLQYGISIMTVYQQMLASVIPGRLLAAGLTAPTPTAPAAPGPSLAPLPNPQAR